MVRRKAQEFGQGWFWNLDEGWWDARCSQFTDVEGREVPGSDEEVVLGGLTDRSPKVGGFALLHFGSGAGGEVEVVHFVNEDQVDTDMGRGDADSVDDFGEVGPVGEGQAEEAGELDGQHPRGGCGRDGDIVSRARLAASGRYGVIDRVRTRAADQRRGMGRTVMTMLGIERSTRA
ncbi:hypothetical protein [Verrucosispora sp. ts21]|uniref:hypothetical protein n=1 Tax=Verrucosispora sp. ts21 TaxID=2069341 RepID=UPI001304D00F|nr:hypothetical protein [Verrucosispora sp. ts21]